MFRNPQPAIRNQKLHIRPYKAGDEEQILRLRGAVFGDLDPVRTTLSAWRWQFLDNPAGESFCVIAEDSGVFVGQYAAIPTRFSVKGNETVFAFSCDTMVHPEYRRKGIFVALADELYRSMKEKNGVTTVWGFPNQASLPGFTGRLGWNLLSAFPLWVRPFRPLTWFCRQVPLLKKVFPAPEVQKESSAPSRPYVLESGLVIEPLSHFHEEFDHLWKRHHGLSPIMQIRDRPYLNWRYLGMPAFGYLPFSIKWKGNLAGFMVLRMMDLMGHSFGVLVDLFPFPLINASVTRLVTDFAAVSCRTQGAEFMTCLFSTASPEFLKDLGFRKVPNLFNPKKWYLGCRFEGNSDIPDSVMSWFISYGDTDIV